MKQEKNKAVIGQALPDVKQGLLFHSVINNKMFLPKHCQAMPDLRSRARRGFTLIELLVVVLIIGILAAVAVPQYRLAVDKARLSNLVTMVSSVAKAQEAYYLTNGEYTNDWDNLAVSFAGTVNRKDIITTSGGQTLDLDTSGPKQVVATDTKLNDVRVVAFYAHGNENLPQSPTGGGVSCYAKENNKYANKLCKNVTQKNARDSGSGSGEDSYNVYKFDK